MAGVLQVHKFPKILYYRYQQALRVFQVLSQQANLLRAQALSRSSSSSYCPINTLYGLKLPS